MSTDLQSCGLERLYLDDSLQRPDSLGQYVVFASSGPRRVELLINCDVQACNSQLVGIRASHPLTAENRTPVVRQRFRALGPADDWALNGVHT